MLELFEQVGKAIGDPSRLRILKLLEPEELCVCQITAVLDLAPATVSKHLSLLRQAGLVEQRKAGRWVYYRTASRSRNPYALEMLALVRKVLGEDAIITADRKKLTTVKEIPMDALCASDAVTKPDPDPNEQAAPFSKEDPMNVDHHLP